MQLKNEASRHAYSVGVDAPASAGASSRLSRVRDVGSSRDPQKSLASGREVCDTGRMTTTNYCTRCGDRLWESADMADAVCDACRDELTTAAKAGA